jgi:hypothetical protein
MEFDEAVTPPIGGWNAYCAWARENRAREHRETTSEPRSAGNATREGQNAPRDG